MKSTATEGDGAPYGAFVRFRVRQGHADKVEELLLNASATLRDNPACLLYEIGRPADDADEVIVVELWEDAAAHSASLEVPAIRAIIGEVVPLLAGPPTASTFRPVGGRRPSD